MKKTAIICEINPYHKGHRYLFEQARATSELVIAVMSGNFVQRGIPAVFDKYTRASLLVTPSSANGESAADLVVELPFPWCACGMESFAMGGVAVALGVGADSLACGSECGDTELVLRAAKAKASEAYLRRLMDYEKAAAERGEGSAVLHDRVMQTLGFHLGANDKLAVEYAKNLADHDMSFRVYPRISGADTPYRSATQLRDLIYRGDFRAIAPYVPAEAFPLYEANRGRAVGLCRYRSIVHTYCRLFADASAVFAEGGGGLWSWILSVAAKTATPDAFFEGVATKKYTDTRILRAILFAMLKVEKEMAKVNPEFTLLLAANEKGRAHLASLRKRDDFSIVTKPADVPEPVRERYALHASADRLYTMCMDSPEPSDFYIRKHPVILP